MLRLSSRDSNYDQLTVVEGGSAGKCGGRRGRMAAAVGMLCTRFVMRQHNDRRMKTLRALGDRLTAVGKDVLIERG